MASFIKAATLAKMAMDSNEYLQESRSKGGVLRNELFDFLEVSLSLNLILNLIQFSRVTAVISMRGLLRWKIS